MMYESPESTSSRNNLLPEVKSSSYNRNDFIDQMMESDEETEKETVKKPSSLSSSASLELPLPSTTGATGAYDGINNNTSMNTSLGVLSPVLEHQRGRSFSSSPTNHLKQCYSPGLKSILRSRSKQHNQHQFIDMNNSDHGNGRLGGCDDFYASEPNLNFHMNHNSSSSMPSIVSMDDEAFNSSLNSIQSNASQTSTGCNVVFDERVHVAEFVPIERRKLKHKVWYTRAELAKMERKATLKILKHSKRNDLDLSAHSDSSSGRAFYTHPAMVAEADDEEEERSHKKVKQRFNKMMRRISM
mmetsp:Transcript_769/g.1120  ORF Transcript_769/g.1120 Transcript_769/m.1120 type:complete len:300 (-) Transcript_769:334-1233(-)